MNERPDDGASPILRCDSLFRYFGAIKAVDDISFNLNRGDILGIGGPNGAGKTTLFDVISGLTPADKGSIFFDGHDITKLPPHRRCHGGLARTFQLNAAFDSLSVRENTLAGSYFGHSNRVFPGVRFSKESVERADWSLELVGTSDESDMPVDTLPVYKRKMLMIAGALSTNPLILMMDEPVGGLNPNEIDDIMEIVRKVRDAGVTILMIEHVMRFLVTLSDRVIIMHHGKNIYDGKPSELASDKTVVDVYLGEGASELIADALGDAGDE